MSRRNINIENFNQDAREVRFTSPRSIEACRRQGIYPVELTKVAYEMVEQEVKTSLKKDSKIISPSHNSPKIPGYVNRQRQDDTHL